MAEPDQFLGGQPHSESFVVPEVGARATVTCTIRVMAAYESEELCYPHLRRDWAVDGIRLERRALIPVPGEARTFMAGDVLRVDDIEAMHCWDDEPEHEFAQYLVDLRAID